MCVLDKRDKEIYFEEDPDKKEYVFGYPNILTVKANNPTWTLKVCDWGYIYRVFNKGIVNSIGDYVEYDTFLLIVVTSGVTGLLWFILSIVDIKKFKNTIWNLSCCVIFIKMVEFNN